MTPTNQRIDELKVVRLKAEFCPEADTGSTKVLQPGEIGTIVHVYPHQDGVPDAMEVEFVNPFGDGPGCFTIPDSILEEDEGISNIPPTPVSEFFATGELREVMPIVTGYQLKFCCSTCGERWNEILPAVQSSVCGRCGADGVQPYESVQLEEAKTCPEQSPALVGLIIDALNSALAADPAAISMLFGIRVPCNQTLADHPTVQVLAPPQAGFTVSAMGVINAVAAAVTGAPGNTDGLIAVEWDIPESRARRFLKFPTGGVVPLGTTILQ